MIQYKYGRTINFNYPLLAPQRARQQQQPWGMCESVFCYPFLLGIIVVHTKVN